jgi:hypothetical protein
LWVEQGTGFAGEDSDFPGLVSGALNLQLIWS